MAHFPKLQRPEALLENEVGCGGFAVRSKR